jgi:chromosome segregation ATPase
MSLALHLASSVSNASFSPIDVEPQPYCSWQKRFLMANVAIAVAGFALSIFAAAPIAILGYGLLGVVSAVGLYISKDVIDGKKLQELTSLLAERDEKIEQSQKIAADLQKALREQQVLLDNADHHLRDSLAAVSRENEAFKARNEELEKVTIHLQNENRFMKKNNDELQEKMEVISTLMGDMSGQVHSLVSEQLALGKQVDAFSHQATGLSELSRTLDGSVERFEESFEADFLRLSKQLEALGAVSKTILASASEEKASLQKQIVNLSSIGSEVAEKIKALDQKMQQMSERENEFLATIAHLEQTKNDLLLSQKKSDELERTLSEKTKALMEIESKIVQDKAQFTEKMQRVHEEISRISQEKIKELDALNEQAEIKRQMILELDHHLAYKMASIDDMPSSFV